MKILYIEDTEGYIRGVQRVATHLGHTLITAAYAQEGLNLIHQEQPDLILIDINLPDYDGLTLARQVRQEGNQTPIVAVTGDLVNNTRTQAIDAGCNEFLEKPLEIATIMEVIQRFAKSAVPPKGA